MKTIKGNLIGFCHKSGIYKNYGKIKGNTKPYNKLELYLTMPIKEISEPNRYIRGIGKRAYTIKCKWENFKEVFQDKINKIEDLKAYINTEIEVLFNEDKKIELILLEK